jgi:hypothetical protein
LDLCKGELLGFDFASIESDLRDSLLPSAQPFAIAVIEYSFKGELTVTGALSMLGQKIKQEELLPSVLDQLWIEIDTEHRLSLLMTQLEDCVSFISSASGRSQINGDTKLSSFLTDVLMIDSQKWADISCPTMITYVCLKHIKSVINGLNERKHGGNLFYNLPAKFKKSLTTEQTNRLIQCVKHAKDLKILVNALHDLLMKLNESGLTFEEFIFYNLPYVGDGQLDGCDWYQEWFPKDLTLDYTYETYYLLKRSI